MYHTVTNAHKVLCTAFYTVVVIYEALKIMTYDVSDRFAGSSGSRDVGEGLAVRCLRILMGLLSIREPPLSDNGTP